MTTLHPPFWRGWSHHLGQAIKAMTVVTGLFNAGFLLLVLGSSAPMGSFTREVRAQLDIKSIQSALKLYQRKEGHYPSTTEGLQALVSIGALEQLPRDPWDDEYHYALWRGVPRIWSYGADGRPGGEEKNADLYNLSVLPRWLIESDEPSRANAP